MSSHGTRILAAGAAIALSLSACAGGSIAEPTGGQAGAATSSGGGGSSTSSSGSAVGAGISCTIDGQQHTWPQGPVGSMSEISIDLLQGAVRFQTPLLPRPALGLLLGDATKTGDLDCTSFANELWAYDTDGQQYITGLKGGSCALTVTQVATAKGERWTGTFSGVVISLANTEMKIEGGTFDLVY
jgi:hypothetical protein